MKSLLFQPGQTPFIEPTGCGAIPCRTEVPLSILRDGRIYEFILRDKIVPEDPYVNLVKAISFAIQENEPYSGTLPGRALKDFMVKSNIII